MRKFIRLLVSRGVITGLLVLFQLAIILIFVLMFTEYFIPFQLFCLILGCICGIMVVRSDSNPAYKVAWLFPMLIFPILGALLYLIFGSHYLSKRKRKKMDMIDRKQKELVSSFDPKVKCDDPEANRQVMYLRNAANAPAYKNSFSKFLPSGESKLNVLLEELEKAESFIFMEYFIIREGDMWDKVLDVLKRKAISGVDVRIIYDDFGCLTSLDSDYPKQLEKFGIKCKVFNKIAPELNPRLNNRDHRKICVIDGRVGFTGGINFSDEYINKKKRCGHWKDTAVMIKGKATTSLTVMFLGMWEYITKQKENIEDYYDDNIDAPEGEGYVIPYSDNPLDSEPIGQNVYLNMINSAKDYIYITTPYLILENIMTTALCNAAKSGVDVRIITPGIPDKEYMFDVTRSNYNVLLQAGVKIYEYTPGFIHAKMFVCDDKYATIGTVNLDYRSLFLHFECGTWFCDCQTVLEIKNDILNTLFICENIPVDFVSKKSLPRRIIYMIARAFAPLL